MGDILKEAIADAKAVRETALQNAKIALEEAFTPQLKSMLSAKLREEEDDEAEEGRHEEGEHEEGHGDDDAEEGRLSAGAHDDEAEEGMHDEGEHEEGAHDDEAEEGRHDKEEGMHDEGEHEEGMHDDDDDDMDEDLDLEAVIKELEAEINEKEDDDDEDAEEGRGMKEDEDLEEEFEIDESLFEEDEELEEVDKSSAIGKGTGKGDTDKSSDIGKGDNKLAEIKSELKEYKEAVKFLKDKLHEVNILNAKLLFTNKLFKEYSLDNSQKLKVVETFDRAQTTREIKLVYSTLAESFKTGPITRKTKNINESASSAIGSTKPSTESKKVITEETQVADRFRKLAGLIK